VDWNHGTSCGGTGGTERPQNIKFLRGKLRQELVFNIKKIKIAIYIFQQTAVFIPRVRYKTEAVTWA
jgi:hypothetical protein